MTEEQLVAWEVWLDAEGYNPVMIHRIDAEAAFAAGWAAGELYTEHAEAHFASVSDCRYCRQQREGNTR